MEIKEVRVTRKLIKHIKENEERLIELGIDAYKESINIASGWYNYVIRHIKKINKSVYNNSNFQL